MIYIIIFIIGIIIGYRLGKKRYYFDLYNVFYIKRKSDGKYLCYKLNDKHYYYDYVTASEWNKDKINPRGWVSEPSWFNNDNEEHYIKVYKYNILVRFMIKIFEVFLKYIKIK